MLDDLHIPPSNILLAGDSAGGGLCLALLMYLRDNNYPLPAGAILMSPWVGGFTLFCCSGNSCLLTGVVDLTRSCDSWDSNASFDIVPIPANGDHLDPVACYLGSNMERYLTHPYASPLFGDFTSLPPLLIQAGESEVLRDEVTLLAHKATLAGVRIMHELYEDAVSLHVNICLLLYQWPSCTTDSRIPSISFPRSVTTRIRIVSRLRETRLCPRSTTRSPST